MKILVLSDSHSALRFMYHCVDAVMPDVILHLGDHYDDAEALAEEYPDIRMYHVPGNCDRSRMYKIVRETLCYGVCGVRLLMTHGHVQWVKSGLGLLLKAARAMNAQAALYGHTHRADCHQEDDGLWVLNPGSCGSYGGSVGIIETDNGKIISCRIAQQEDLEDIV